MALNPNPRSEQPNTAIIVPPPPLVFNFHAVMAAAANAIQREAFAILPPGVRRRKAFRYHATT